MSNGRKLVIQVDDDPLMTRLAARIEYRDLPDHELRQVLVGDGLSDKSTWEDPVQIVVAALQAGREIVLVFDANVFDERGCECISAHFVEKIGVALSALPDVPSGRIAAFFVWSDDESAAMKVLKAARDLQLPNCRRLSKQKRLELQSALREVLSG